MDRDVTMSIRLTIDGKPLMVSPPTTIWQAARDHGITIPSLCYSPKLPASGVCRLCVVDVGARVLAASCVRECEDGMDVKTDTARVIKQRRMLTALLLADHPSPCVKEQTTGDCELEALGRNLGCLGHGHVNPIPPSSRGPRVLDESSKVIRVDHQACILCDRCIRACDQIQCNDVIGRTGKGYLTRIGFDLNVPMGTSSCVSCGECVAACPTGALTNKSRSLPLIPRDQARAVDSLCPYCGVGCATTYFADGNRMLWAEGRENPGNQGRLCVKGRYGWDYVEHPHRLTTPLIRRSDCYPKGPLSDAVRGIEGRRDRVVDYGQVMPAFREATWDEALDLIAYRLRSIKERLGGDALAGFGSAKCSNEEAYLFQKMMRAVLGTNNVDHCTRLCHASSVAALMEGIGSGAVTDTFGHAALADVILLTGSNTTANHPVAATFFKQAARRGTRLIVVDPRRPPIADDAELFCQIRPGTDVAFYYALMHVIIREGLHDREFIESRTENFEALRKTVSRFSPDRVAPICAITVDTLEDVARKIGRSRQFMIFWGMGISQHTHGTDNARCLIALCLLTGNIGRPGTGLHPLRGQNNVQGASDAGLIPMVFPDYQPVANATIRRKFEQAWGVSLNPNPGLTVVEIMSAAGEGRIKGMFMLGENPFLSDPNVNKVRRALSQLDFLAVQEIFFTETAEFADVILPAASFFEKLGTYTNTDRRVQLGRPVITAPGSARPDWEILCDLIQRLGGTAPYTTPAEVFDEFAALTESYRGLSHSNIGPNGRIWPVGSPDDSETPVLFADRFPTATGRGRFVPCELRHADELPDHDFPFVLNTGRVLEHWHTGVMTRRSAALDAIQPTPFVEINSNDVQRLGIRDGDDVVVTSRRGSIRLSLRASDRVAPGTVFIPFHFREAAANILTNDALDPSGKIPEYKYCAVRIERAS